MTPYGIPDPEGFRVFRGPNPPRQIGIYLRCPGKGGPRKHIEVCRKCRSRKKCAVYGRYVQPELPFGYGSG